MPPNAPPDGSEDAQPLDQNVRSDALAADSAASRTAVQETLTSIDAILKSLSPQPSVISPDGPDATQTKGMPVQSADVTKRLNPEAVRDASVAVFQKLIRGMRAQKTDPRTVQNLEQFFGRVGWMVQLSDGKWIPLEPYVPEVLASETQSRPMIGLVEPQGRNADEDVVDIHNVLLFGRTHRIVTMQTLSMTELGSCLRLMDRLTLLEKATKESSLQNVLQDKRLRTDREKEIYSAAQALSGGRLLEKAREIVAARQLRPGKLAAMFQELSEELVEICGELSPSVSPEPSANTSEMHLRIRAYVCALIDAIIDVYPKAEGQVMQINGDRFLELGRKSMNRLKAKSAEPAAVLVSPMPETKEMKPLSKEQVSGDIRRIVGEVMADAKVRFAGQEPETTAICKDYEESVEKIIDANAIDVQRRHDLVPLTRGLQDALSINLQAHGSLQNASVSEWVRSELQERFKRYTHAADRQLRPSPQYATEPHTLVQHEVMTALMEVEIRMYAYIKDKSSDGDVVVEGVIRASTHGLLKDITQGPEVLRSSADLGPLRRRIEYCRTVAQGTEATVQAVLLAHAAELAKLVRDLERKLGLQIECGRDEAWKILRPHCENALLRWEAAERKAALDAGETPRKGMTLMSRHKEQFNEMCPASIGSLFDLEPWLNFRKSALLARSADMKSERHAVSFQAMRDEMFVATRNFLGELLKRICPAPAAEEEAFVQTVLQLRATKNGIEQTGTVPTPGFVRKLSDGLAAGARKLNVRYKSKSVLAGALQPILRKLQRYIENVQQDYPDSIDALGMAIAHRLIESQFDYLEYDGLRGNKAEGNHCVGILRDHLAPIIQEFVSIVVPPEKKEKITKGEVKTLMDKANKQNRLEQTDEDVFVAFKNTAKGHDCKVAHSIYTDRVREIFDALPQHMDFAVFQTFARANRDAYIPFEVFLRAHSESVLGTVRKAWWKTIDIGEEMFCSAFGRKSTLHYSHALDALGQLVARAGTYENIIGSEPSDEHAFAKDDLDAIRETLLGICHARGVPVAEGQPLADTVRALQNYLEPQLRTWLDSSDDAESAKADEAIRSLAQTLNIVLEELLCSPHTDLDAHSR